MALASASHGVGGGARFLDFWRISAVFDPIWEGTRTTGRGPRNTGFRSGVQIRRPDPASRSGGPVIERPGFFPDIVAGKLS
mgnify:CR=1 FL=1|jgi:hypothetical protein